MTPDFQIIANSVDQTALFKDRLIRLTLSDQAGQKSDTVQITLDNRDNRIALPEVGAVLEIYLGFLETGLVYMGRYVVDDLSGDLFPATLTISAKAADTAGDKEPLLQIRHRHASQDEAQSAADRALQRSKRASGKWVVMQNAIMTAESDRQSYWGILIMGQSSLQRLPHRQLLAQCRP